MPAIGGLRVLVTGLAAVLAFPVVEAAAAQRTFVASHGSDSAPCTLAQPCRSFGAAIAQTNDGGEVIVLDSAGYGPFSVSKSVTVAAPAGVHAGISVPSNQSGVSINAPGAVVVLRGLSIVGASCCTGNYGVRFVQGAELRVENCDISGMHDGLDVDLGGGAALHVRDSAVSSNFQGLRVHGGGHAALERVRFADNFEWGVFLDNAGDAVLRDVEIDNNQGGTDFVIAADTAASAVTISRGHLNSSCADSLFVTATATAGVIVSDSEVAGNIACGSGGIDVATTGGGAAHVSLVRTGLSGNSTAVVTTGAGATAYLDDSLVVANPSSGYGIYAAGGPIYTRLNNTIRGTTIGPNFVPYPAR